MSICPTTAKTQYSTEKDALAGLDRMLKIRPEYDGESYYCLYCSYYHFGRKQVKKARKRTGA